MPKKLDYWNGIFDNFLNALISTFPDNKVLPAYKKSINDLQQNPKLGNRIVKHVLNYIEPHINKIKACDESVFVSDEPVYLLKDVDFRELWSNASPKTKVAIWSHLQSIYVTGSMVVRKDVEETTINEMSKAISTVMAQAPQSADISSGNASSMDDSNIKEGTDLIMDIVGEIDPMELFGNFFKNADPTNMNPQSIMTAMLSNSGSNSALERMSKTIEDKVSSSNIDQSKLQAAAQAMMANLQSGNLGFLENLSNKKK